MAVPGERNLGVLLSEQRAEVVVMPVREGEDFDRAIDEIDAKYGL